MQAAVIGGKKWKKFLERIAEAKLNVRAGVLDAATASDGTPVAEYAAVQEFGGTMSIPEQRRTLKFRKNEAGQEVFAHASRKRGITKVRDVVMPAHTVTVPARPFLRTAAERFSAAWAAVFARAARGRAGSPGAIREAAEELGLLMEKDIQGLIESESLPPPLAASTVAAKRAKGYPNPDHALIETGAMQRAISHTLVDE